MESQIHYRREILKDKNWIYRGEGGQNLVIANVEERYVLRFMKVSSSTIATETDQSLKRQMQLFRFLENNVKSLIGEEFLPPLELVFVSSEDVVELNGYLEPFRPAHRQSMIIPPNCCLALKMPDCVFLPSSFGEDGLGGPTIALEIKPKCGFLVTDAPLLSHLILKKKICKYQLTQQKKLREFKIKSLSSYCPIDLFSGCLARMQRAILALLKNPQNNLRIFQDGTLIFSEETDSTYEEILQKTATSFFVDEDYNALDRSVSVIAIGSLLSDLVIKALLKRSRDCNQSESSVHSSQYCICQSLKDSGKHPPDNILEGAGLSKNCVLGKILSVQKLDKVDVEGIHEPYQLFQKFSSEFSSNTLDRWLYGDFESDEHFTKLGPDKQQIVKMIRDFLLSISAKDCSVMVTFRRIIKNKDQYDPNFVISGANGFYYLMKISVLDFDMKPHIRIPKYFKEGRELILGFQRL